MRAVSTWEIHGEVRRCQMRWVAYDFMYIATTMLALLEFFFASWYWSVRRRAVNFRQGSQLVWRDLEDSLDGAICGVSKAKRVYLSEIASVILETYAWIAVSVKELRHDTSSNLPKILKHLPAIFAPALFDIENLHFEIEFALAALLAGVVLGAMCWHCCRVKRLTMDGAVKLAQQNSMRTILDACSIAVVKTFLSASICRYTGAKTGPVLAVSGRIHCSCPEQIVMAIISGLGAIIWFVWIFQVILRKSIGAQPILNLYDYPVATSIIQAKLALGVASAAFSNTRPCALLTISLVTTTLLFVFVGAHGAPCRFVIVNRLRLAGLSMASFSSVVVLSQLDCGAGMRVPEAFVLSWGAVILAGIELRIGLTSVLMCQLIESCGRRRSTQLRLIGT